MLLICYFIIIYIFLCKIDHFLSLPCSHVLCNHDYKRSLSQKSLAYNSKLLTYVQPIEERFLSPDQSRKRVRLKQNTTSENNNNLVLTQTRQRNKDTRANSIPSQGAIVYPSLAQNPTPQFYTPNFNYLSSTPSIINAQEQLIYHISPNVAYSPFNGWTPTLIEQPSQPAVYYSNRRFRNNRNTKFRFVAEEKPSLVIKGLLPVETSEENTLNNNVTSSSPSFIQQPILNLTKQQLMEPIIYDRYGDGATLDLPTNIYAYCYPFTDDQITSKCSGAKEFNATGIYIPMMMEIQYKYHKLWYSQLKRLKGTSGMNLIGIAFGNPNWDLIIEILNENRLLFAGILIEWIDDKACITNINLPTVNQLIKINEYTTDGILRYFVRNQNFFVCGTPREKPVFLNNRTTSLPELIKSQQLENTLNNFEQIQKTKLYFPEFIQPVYSCAAGQEGLCYHAFYSNPSIACGENQRYLFNPYEINAGRLMHMLNETCAGLPSHDLYGVL